MCKCLHWHDPKFAYVHIMIDPSPANWMATFESTILFLVFIFKILFQNVKPHFLAEKLRKYLVLNYLCLVWLILDLKNKFFRPQNLGVTIGLLPPSFPYLLNKVSNPSLPYFHYFVYVSLLFLLNISSRVHAKLHCLLFGSYQKPVILMEQNSVTCFYWSLLSQELVTVTSAFDLLFWPK